MQRSDHKQHFPFGESLRQNQTDNQPKYASVQGKGSHQPPPKELVGSSSSSLSSPEQRLMNAEEKLSNLSRLLTLSQNLSEQRHRELRQENTSLHHRVDLLEKRNTELMDQLTQLAVQQRSYPTVMEELRRELNADRLHRVETEEKLRNEITVVAQSVAEDSNLKEMASIKTELLESSHRSQQETTKALEQLLAATSVKIAVQNDLVKNQIDEIRTWAKQSFQSMSEQLTQLQSDVAVALQHHADRLKDHRCSADGKCRRLKEMLIRKTGEVDLMTRAIDVELEKVRQVAHHHANFRK